MPLEIVMQLFRKMGCVVLFLYYVLPSDLRRPRVILVSQEGRLVGLVTVKDVLRHEAANAHGFHKAQPVSTTPTRPTSATGGASGSGAGHGRIESTPSYNAWRDVWADIEEGGPGRGLEIALEEGWMWFRTSGSRAYNLVLETYRRATGGGSSGERRGEEDYEFELREEREGERPNEP
jgi:chloride channel 3/4/5